jgi:hypothetical protein
MTSAPSRLPETGYLAEPGLHARIATVIGRHGRPRRSLGCTQAAADGLTWSCSFERTDGSRFRLQVALLGTRGWLVTDTR